MSKDVKAVELDTVRDITDKTRELLESIGLWGKADAWTPAMMWHLAKGENSDGIKMRDQICFEQVILATKRMVPERMMDLMNEYICALDRESRDHLKDAMEYATLYNQKEVLRKIIERNRNDVHLEEWLMVYSLLLEVLEGNLSYKGIINKSRDLVGHVFDTVLKTRLELLEVYAYERLGYTEKATSLIDHLPEKFLRIQQGFTKSVLASRAALSMANCLLFVKGDSERAHQQYLSAVKNDSPSEVMLAYVNHGLGLSTLFFEDGRCLQYIRKAISHAKQAGLTEYAEMLEREDYPFIRNVQGEKFDLTGVVQEEKIHQYIVRGNSEEALRLIEEVEKQGKDSAFLTYYKGKATKDKFTLARALERFEVESKLHLLPLVKREIGIPFKKEEDVS
ncbi:AimR family lysis-lysogeny pheromone receptor [Shouchella lonarensis]|uniref:Uncharacterized protein n=1 Tax=Shouchella lonarensis TaxID=1464122 RepID=A0A1G6IK63_9BACI|nr:AimR family lysis-lysogeny pheromone receptor [Shouchella lonarensis]SDC06972.1 hypothetical protein SAMN05421737_10594 [Shouchella lonarensis]